MHLLYTSKSDVDVTVFSVRNPLYFTGPEASAETVTVDGEHPQIVAAYKALGIAVESLRTGGKASDTDERATLIAELQERGVEFDEAWPTDELRALSITPAQPQDAPARRGRKPAQPKE